jgi:hypothetical protein
MNTAYIVDVMACIRRVRMKSLKTFGDFIDKGFFDMVLNLCKNASCIDLVFDTYLDGSVKDSERKRRSTTQAIEINNLLEDTLLPVDMDTFRPSSSNKVKLQLLLRKWIIANGSQKCPGIQIILSGTGVAEVDRNPCQSLTCTDQLEFLPDLDVDIEEADVQMTPHVLHELKKWQNALLYCPMTQMLLS